MKALLTHLFPAWAGPEAKLAKAQQYLEASEFNEARWLLEELDHPDAPTLRLEARRGLAQSNLEEGRARYSAGDRAGAEEHLALAREFGATSEQCREARRVGRSEAPPKKTKPIPAEPMTVGQDPLWSLPPDDPRLRYAVLVESYPDHLRDRLLELGPDFATAVLLIDNGQPQEAEKQLTRFIEQDPVARYERARAALAATHLPAAASDLMSFGEAVGHQRIGTNHTAVLLGQVFLSLNRAEEALGPVTDCRDQATTPSDQHVLDAMRVQLLSATGQLDEADVLATQLVRTAPRDMGVIRMLAQIRLAKGHRDQAMGILEDGLNRCCSSPGRCGNQPLDVQAARTLVRLYLEDRIAPKRTRELLGQLAQNVSKPTWEDRYLAALVARNEGQPHARDLVQRLTAELAPTDRRHQRLSTAFSDAMSS